MQPGNHRSPRASVLTQVSVLIAEYERMYGKKGFRGLVIRITAAKHILVLKQDVIILYPAI